MTITWHGISCFSIKAKIGATKEEAVIVIDPYDNSTGLRFPRTLSADIAAVSEAHPHANNVSAVGGNPFLIREPGEYEVKGIFVYGISAPRDGRKREERMVFRIAAEDLSVAHLGALDRPLTNGELAHFENADILILPVGGGEVLDAKRASELVEQIEPRIVIPMWYALPNLKLKLAPVDGFLKVMGATKAEVLPRLKISKRDLPDEGIEVRILSRD